MLITLQRNRLFDAFRRSIALFRYRTVRTFSLLFAAGLGLSLLLTACSPNSNSSSTATSPTANSQSAVEVNIGYQKASTVLNLMRTKPEVTKALTDAGITLTWTEFPAGPPMLEAMNAGSIDLGYTGEAPPIFAQVAGTPLLYVAYDPWSPKAEAIVVPQN
ncbi:MAG TPA: hypothetical protein V6C65_15815, partial [Allocoleopsis sp.]